jgi:hypothetical protein
VRWCGILGLLLLVGCSPAAAPEVARADHALRRDPRTTSHARAEATLDWPHLTPPPVVARTDDAAPRTIRVWRRSIDHASSSCAGRVDVVPFEDYVKRVVPHEWIPSWQPEALKAGAVAARSYAMYWVQHGGKSIARPCADIDDTTASQVYKEDDSPPGDAAGDATVGQVVVDANGVVAQTEYSAENGSPTADGVDDSVCAGRSRDGHGRGMCQWGTQRWAQAGKDYAWMVSHYYPGMQLATTAGISIGSPDPGPGPGGAPALPNLAARFLSTHDPPAEMVSGQQALVWIEYTNEGAESWDVNRTMVGTTGPRDRQSPFYTEGNWISASRSTAMDTFGSVTSCATGYSARFSFILTAPQVTEATTFVEHFGLIQEGEGWFGPGDDVVEFSILVRPPTPGEPVPPPVSEPDPSMPDPPGSDVGTPDDPSTTPDRPAAEGGGDNSLVGDPGSGGCAYGGAPAGQVGWGALMLLGVWARRRR